MNAPMRPPGSASPSAPASPSFVWEDPFLLEDQLTEDERAIRDVAQSFAQEQLLPGIVEAYADEKTDPGLFRKMGELGLLGVTLPEEYGCAGASYVAYGLVARAVEAVDSGYRSMMSVQSSLVMYPIYAYGDETQRKRYLPKLASGEWVGCFGLTEPDAMDPTPGSMKSRSAKKTSGAATRLTGAKMWISNSTDRRCVRRVGQGNQRKRRGNGRDPGLRAQAGHAKGLSAHPRSAASSRAAGPLITGEIVMDGVVLSAKKRRLLPNVSGPQGSVHLPEQRPLRHLLGRARRGRRLLPPCAAIHARQEAVQPAVRRRRNWMQKKLADMETEITLGLQGCAPRLVAMFDEGTAGAGGHRRSLKRNNCGKALDIARQARDMHGGNGIMGEYHVMRHAQNLETVNTYEGTHDVHALILGRAQTGLQAFF